MKKLFINLLTIFVILFAIFWCLDLLFTKVYQAGDYTKIQWLYKMQNQHFDFALNGSSRAYTTVSIESIEKDTDLDGINISVDGSTITDQYLMLKIFLENGNTMDKLFLQVDPWSINLREISPFAIPKFFPYLKEEAVFEHFKQFGPKWYAYRYIPFLRYAEYNTVWGIHQFLNDLLDLFPQDFNENGGYFYPPEIYRGATELQDLRYELDGDYKFLGQIISLCKENNIELVLFTAPVSNINITKGYFKNMEQFRIKMANQGVEYINYAHVYGNKVDNFTDEIHLNPSGVLDFTKRIKESLVGKETKVNKEDFVISTTSNN